MIGTCRLFGCFGFLVGWPDSVDSILAYCVYMFKASLASSTMGGRLAAITFMAWSLGFPDPCRDFRAMKALEVWARAKFHGRDTRLPVSPGYVAAADIDFACSEFF